MGFDDGEIGAPLASDEIPIGARKMAAVSMESSPPAKPVLGITSVNQTTTPQRKIIPPSTATTVNDSGSDSSKKGPRRVQLITLSTTPATINSTSAAMSNSVTANNSSVTVNRASSHTTPVNTPDIVIP